MRTFEEYLVEQLQDPENASGFLEVILDEYNKDHELAILLSSLRSIATAKGVELPQEVNQKVLDTLLSVDPNPTCEQLIASLTGT